MTPFITVGIITCDRLPFLKEAIESVFKQDCQVTYEIVIVDDGSKDGTREYLRNLIDDRVRSTSFNQNMGRPAARNAVVEMMRGEYLMWLDDDDAFTPYAISSQVASIKKHPEADIHYSSMILCDEHLNPKEVYTPFKVEDVHPSVLYYLFITENRITNPGTVISKTVFDRVGAYDLEFTRSQDFDFWVRALSAGCKFVRNPDSFYYYRGHGGNYQNSTAAPENKVFHSKIITKAIERTPIEIIFPMYPWASQREESHIQAFLVLALIYLRISDTDMALKMVEISRQQRTPPESLGVEGLIRYERGEWTQAINLFQDLIVHYNKAEIIDIMTRSCLNVGDDLAHILEPLSVAQPLAATHSNQTNALSS